MSHSRALPNLTEGSILKSLLAIAVPVLLVNLLQTAYNLIDTFWVGRLGAEATAAVSLGFPIIFLMVSLGAGLTMAGSILVAQYKGRNDFERIDHVAGQTMIMVFLISLFLTVVGYFISEPALRLMTDDETVLPMAVSYMQVTFLGMISLFGYFSFQSLMRGVGDVKKPLYIAMFTVSLNFFLDPAFMFGWWFIPAMGVTGAAVATIVCEGLATLIGITMLFSGKYGVHLKLKNLGFDWKLIKEMFRIGIPSSVDQSVRSLGLAVIVILVSAFGTSSVAAYGIGARMIGFIIIPAVGLAIATSTLVGQNMGAGKPERAEKVFMVSAMIGFFGLLAVAVLSSVFAENIVMAFIPNDLEVIGIGSEFVRIMAFCFPFMGFQQIVGGAFMGAGHSFSAMLLGMISFWVIHLPIAYVLSRYTSLGETGLWYSYPIASFLGAMVALVWVMRGSWKVNKVSLSKEEILSEKVREEVLTEESL